MLKEEAFKDVKTFMDTVMHMDNVKEIMEDMKEGPDIKPNNLGLLIKKYAEEVDLDLVALGTVLGKDRKAFQDVLNHIDGGLCGIVDLPTIAGALWLLQIPQQEFMDAFGKDVSIIVEHYFRMRGKMGCAIIDIVDKEKEDDK